ncbi:MAG: hypothetical protein AAEC03_11705 [Synechococcus sp.]
MVKGSGRGPAPEKPGLGMGIILIMPLQMIPVTESSVQVSNAEQYGCLAHQINNFDKASGLNATLAAIA